MTRERMSAEEYINRAGGFAGMEPPQSKYRNKITVVDGVKFHSKAEARRWDELRMLERAGEITDLKRQVAFPLYVNDKLVGKYIADFTFRVPPNPRGSTLADYDPPLVVEDVKGGRATMTDTFRLKAKMFEAQYGFPITIIGGRK